MKRIFTKKFIIWLIVILIIAGLAGYFIFGRKGNQSNIQTDTVKRQNLIQTVLATGQVVSSTDLNLSFQTSGVVNQIKVKEGDKVKAGQVLASLDMANASANLTTARGNLAQAKANYEKVLAGASNEQIRVAEQAVSAAEVVLQNAENNLVIVKAQQDTAVANAYSALLNTVITPIADAGNIDTVLPVITGTYNSTEAGMYKIKVFNTGTGLKFQTFGLENVIGDASNIPAPLGNKGLFIQFLSTPSLADSWTVYIPNTYSSVYVTNNNVYQAALKSRDSAVVTAESTINSAKISLAQAQASLNQIIAAARPADIDVAKAQILSAEGQVAVAEAAIANATIKAPVQGTITSVDIKVGELASALKEVMILQDIDNLHIEADISEANIADISSEQTIDVTFDALGPDKHYEAKIATINPASTIISGVVNFKVIAKIDKVAEIRPGMTANLVILVANRDNVLTVPSSSIIIQNNKSFIRVITDTQKKTFAEVQVQTGLDADGGLVEIISGVNEGQQIVTFIK
jgi:HlyD family secretion protein